MHACILVNYYFIYWYAWTQIVNIFISVIYVLFDTCIRGPIPLWTLLLYCIISVHSRCCKQWPFCKTKKTKQSHFMIYLLIWLIKKKNKQQVLSCHLSLGKIVYWLPKHLYLVDICINTCYVSSYQSDLGRIKCFLSG